ncbi:MAG: hypothetical protein QXD70_05575 [Candidatus Bathyarchaeia archaeon]
MSKFANKWGAKPAANTVAEKAKKSPVKKLSRKQDDGTWLNINLFANTSKAGKSYFGGNSKEHNLRVAFFENVNGGVLFLNDDKVELRKYTNEDGSIVYSGQGWRLSDFKSKPATTAAK